MGEALIPFYLSRSHEKDVFLRSYSNRLPLLIKGPTGCGKSRFVEHMAHQLGRELVSVSCHDETSSTDLLGRFLIKGGETVWQDGPVLRAIKLGGILYLDEFIEAREDVMVVIHPLTDYRREIFIDRLNQSFQAPPEFMVVVSYNPGYQKGLKELKISTRQRFVGLEFGYPNEKQEAEIVEKESGLSNGQAAKLVEFGQKVRSLKELGLASSVSTRLLIQAAILIREGMNARVAIKAAIVCPLTDDSDIAVGLQDLADVMF